MAANPSDPDPEALRARQAALFEQLQVHPDDLDVMFDYAVTSIKLRDYEPAIATLERMLIYKPDLPRVKLELGSAYFRLGSYEVSRYYFQQVLDGDAPPEVRARVAAFMAQIDERTKRSAFRATVSGGLVYSTNANLGPEDRLVEVLGTTGLLDPEFQGRADFGAALNAGFTHVLDLERPNYDVWITDGAYAGLRFFEETDGDIDAFLLRTGPRLALDDESYGPKLRPFVSGSYVRSGGDTLYFGGGGGFEYLNTLDAATTLLGSLNVSYRNYDSEDDANDGVYGLATLGTAYRLSEQTVLNGGVFAVREQADKSYVADWGLGLRGAVSHRYETGIDTLFEDPWTITAFAQVSHRWYDAADPAVNPDKTRDDTDYRIGMVNSMPVGDGFAVRLEGSYFLRNSNIRNFDLDNLQFGVLLEKSF